MPQVMPAGADVHACRPRRPVAAAVSVSNCLTVSVVLPVFPNGSVAVIVAVPRPTAVTRPVALTVATPELLLVHVIPVPCIFTGVSELLAVPSPNAPRSFSPQQRTDVSGISAHVCADAERHRARIDDARTVHRRGRIRRRAVAKLAEVVVAPAAHRAVRERRAAVVKAGGRRDRVGDTADRDRNLRRTPDPERRSGRSRSAPQHWTVRPGGARSCDRCRGSRDGGVHAARRHAAASPACCRAVADLAADVASPALHACGRPSVAQA